MPETPVEMEDNLSFVRVKWVSVSRGLSIVISVDNFFICIRSVHGGFIRKVLKMKFEMADSLNPKHPGFAAIESTYKKRKRNDQYLLMGVLREAEDMCNHVTVSPEKRF